ncbi:hypothetical protein P0D72_02275 [Paraburkholderia sediminicola]|uniref:hypothetical protein n=1 Tax=Paraburkholderia sediminicola TaxID=458836 RepID=UPI0038B9DF29
MDSAFEWARRIVPGRERLMSGRVEIALKTGFYRFSAFTIRIEIELKVLPRRRTRILTHGSPDF